MKTRIIPLMLVLFLLVCTLSVSAVTWSPQGNISLKDRYYITYDPIGSCDSGYVVQGKNSDGTWDCELDLDTTYTAGSNLTLTGTVFSIDATALKNWLDTLYQKIGNYFDQQLNTTSDVVFNTVNAENITATRFLYNTAGCSDDSTEGNTCWDADAQTVSITTGLGNVIQVGQELTGVGKNNEGAPMYAGQVVYLSGVSGEMPQIKLADASDGDKIHASAVVTIPECNDNALCPVTTFGYVHDLDTSDWSEGDTLYLSDDGSGNLTNVKPTYPNYTVHIATVVRDHASTGIVLVIPEIDITNGVVMNELSLLSNLTVGDSICDLVDCYTISNWLNTTTAFGGDVSGTYDAIAITDSSHAHDWINLSNYPAACPAGSAITQLDDSVTCSDSWVDIDGDTMTGPLVTPQINSSYFNWTVGDDWAIFDGNKWTFNASKLSSTAPNHMSGSELIGIPIIDGATYISVHETLNLFNSAGRATGGEVTDAGSETINVAEGTGFIKATDDDTAELLSFDWPASNGLSIPTDTVRYVGVEYNDGTPQVVVRVSENWDLDTDWPLAKVINSGGSLHILCNPWWVTDGITNIIERFQGQGHLIRDEHVGGLLISVPGTRNLAVTAGTLWSRLNEFPITALDTSVTGDFELYYYNFTSSKWADDRVAQYPVTQWNDITSGDGFTPLGNNRYMNFWVYAEADDDEIAVIYGQAQYVSSAGAEAESPPTFISTHHSESAKLLGRIIIKEGTDAPVQVDTVFDTTFTASQAADHGNLAGLADDDHTQYCLIDGTRVYTYNETYAETSADVTANRSDWFSTYNVTYADWNKTYADTLYRADSWDNFTGIPHATPSDGDVTHFSWADEIFDWVTATFHPLEDQRVGTTDNPTFNNLTVENLTWGGSGGILSYFNGTDYVTDTGGVGWCQGAC